MIPKDLETRHQGLAARLGWVSFFNDASSEVLARALPLVLTQALGASPLFLGWVEGLAESVAILLKAFSGWLSDRMESRKSLVVAGYGLSVAARALYLSALGPLLIGLARVGDRLGKGLRGAPRDAMVADAAAKGLLGRDFGLTRVLDTLGAMAGLGFAVMLGLGRGPVDAALFRTCAWLSLPLGLAALGLLVLWVPRIPRILPAKSLDWRIPRPIRGYLAIVLLFALANSSDAFLVLKALEVGYSFRETLILFLVFNGLAAALAVPAGRLSDRFGRVPFLVLGWGVYACAYAGMGLSARPAVFAAALLGYGAFYGLTEGVEKALLSDLVPAAERGRGFGAFQGTLGLGALAASPLMGFLMARLGTRSAFLFAAILALASALILVLWSLRRRYTSK